MADWMKDLLSHAPFIMTGTTGAPRLNYARLFELFVAVVVILYGMDKQVSSLRGEVDSLKLQLSGISAQVSKLNADVYAPKWEKMPH